MVRVFGIIFSIFDINFLTLNSKKWSHTWKDFLASSLSAVRLTYSLAIFNSLEDIDDDELEPLVKFGLWASSYIAEFEGGGGGGGAFFFFGRSWTV